MLAEINTGLDSNLFNEILEMKNSLLTPSCNCFVYGLLVIRRKMEPLFFVKFRHQITYSAAKFCLSQNHLVLVNVVTLMVTANTYPREHTGCMSVLSRLRRGSFRSLHDFKLHLERFRSVWSVGDCLCCFCSDILLSSSAVWAKIQKKESICVNATK